MAGCVPSDGSDCVRASGDGGDGLCGIGGHVADAEPEDPADRQRVSRRHDGGLGGGPEERGRRLHRGHGDRYRPSQTVTLPTLSSGTTGNYNGVVIADSPADFAPGALSALDTYESTFGVRQVDGYMFPDPGAGRDRRPAARWMAPPAR